VSAAPAHDASDVYSQTLVHAAPSSTGPSSTLRGWMFESSAPFALFDYFRVPHRRVVRADDRALDAERVAVADQTPALMWPSEMLLAGETCAPNPHFIRSIPIFGRLLADPEMRALIRRTGGSWKPVETVRDRRGRPVSALWRAADGGSFLPFDPNEVISNFWTERYVEFGFRARTAPLASLARHAYYHARPLLPRTVQIHLRRSFSRVQKKVRFPRWPLETALDDLFRFLFSLVVDLADDPVPFIGVWPRDRSWALVLTHDVERRTGYENLRHLLDVELQEGYRSSWNFVPCNGYVVERKLREQLRSDGFEIGVHGLFHDGRDVLTRTLPRRLPAIRSYAEQWEAVGFRSPGTIRSARLMPLLGFDYDSSYSDTAPFEPQAGGCATWLPYMIENTVELPITLVQDHTLFDLLQHRDGTLWMEKAKFLRDRGGMALILTHPDYVGNPFLVESYRRFLREFASDSSAWKALPREVSAWWKRRSESSVEAADGKWRVVGPAADEARVEFASAEHLHT
jgi:hypothetical protein